MIINKNKCVEITLHRQTEGVHVSAIVNEGIRALLNLFIITIIIIIIILQEDFTRTKSIKSTKTSENVKSIKSTRNLKTTKSTKIVKSIKGTKSLKTTKSIQSTKSLKSIKRKQATFLLLDVFYVHKKHKKHKKHNDFLPLRCFYAHKNAFFFVFVRLNAFCAFCAREIFL